MKVRVRVRVRVRRTGEGYGSGEARLAWEQPRLGIRVECGARSRGALRGEARRIVRDLEAGVERASGQPDAVHMLAGYAWQRRLLRDKTPHTGVVVVDEVLEQTRRVHLRGRVDGHADGPVADRRQPDGRGGRDKAAWRGSRHKLGCGSADEALCMRAVRVTSVRNSREDGHEPLTRRHPACRARRRGKFACYMWEGSDASSPGHKGKAKGRLLFLGLVLAKTNPSDDKSTLCSKLYPLPSAFTLLRCGPRRKPC